ncbi:MAG TPA: hypothetical protein VI322_03790 [Candidatus Saccharimonadia bacterium]
MIEAGTAECCKLIYTSSLAHLNLTQFAESWQTLNSLVDKLKRRAVIESNYTLPLRHHRLWHVNLMHLALRQCDLGFAPLQKRQSRLEQNKPPHLMSELATWLRGVDQQLLLSLADTQARFFIWCLPAREFEGYRLGDTAGDPVYRIGDRTGNHESAISMALGPLALQLEPISEIRHIPGASELGLRYCLYNRVFQGLMQ